MTLTEAVRALWGKAFSVSQGYKSSHDGLDIAAKEGTPVYAVASGVVRYARDARRQTDKGASGWAMGGGNTVNVLIGTGLQTQYAHLKTFVVREGQTVKKGDLIGYVGRTGGKNPDGSYGGPGSEFVGAHVHFGLWDTVKNKMIDPTSLLTSAAGGTDPGTTGSTVDNPIVKALKRYMTVHNLAPTATVTEDQFWEAVGGLPGFTRDSTEAQQIATNFVGKTWGDFLSGVTQQDGPPDNPLDIAGSILGGVTSIATYALALALVVVGVIIYSRSIGGTGEPAAA